MTLPTQNKAIRNPTYEIDSIIREAHTLVREAFSLWEERLRNEADEKAFRKLHKNLWYVWFFGSAWAIAYFLGYKDFGVVMVLFGAGTAGNIALKRWEFERQARRMDDRLYMVAFDWAKKFGEKDDIFDIPRYLEINETRFGVDIDRRDDERFESWWHQKQREIYEDYYGDETIADSILNERYKK